MWSKSTKRDLKKLALGLGEAERSPCWWRDPPFWRGGWPCQVSPSDPGPLLSCWLLCWFWQTLATDSRRRSTIKSFSQSLMGDASVCQSRLKFLQITKHLCRCSETLREKRIPRKNRKENSPDTTRNNLNTEEQCKHGGVRLENKSPNEKRKQPARV